MIIISSSCIIFIRSSSNCSCCCCNCSSTGVTCCMRRAMQHHAFLKFKSRFLSGYLHQGKVGGWTGHGSYFCRTTVPHLNRFVLNNMQMCASGVRYLSCASQRNTEWHNWCATSCSSIKCFLFEYIFWSNTI